MTSKKLGRRAARIIAGDETLAAMSKHNWQNKVIRVSTHWSGVDGTPLITLVRVREQPRAQSNFGKFTVA